MYHPCSELTTDILQSTKTVADENGEEFQLPDDSNSNSDSDGDGGSDSDGPLAQPILDHSKGPLTPQSNTLYMDTIDSHTQPPTDMAHFFDEYINDQGVRMRQCNACL